MMAGGAGAEEAVGWVFRASAVEIFCVTYTIYLQVFFPSRADRRGDFVVLTTGGTSRGICTFGYNVVLFTASTAKGGTSAAVFVVPVSQAPAAAQGHGSVRADLQSVT